MVNPKQTSLDTWRVLTSNLVSESLRLDNGDIIDDALVGVEVTGKPTDTINTLDHLLSVVSLDDGLGCSLDSLGSDSALHANRSTHTRRGMIHCLPFVIYLIIRDRSWHKY